MKQFLRLFSYDILSFSCDGEFSVLTWLELELPGIGLWACPWGVFREGWPRSQTHSECGWRRLTTVWGLRLNKRMIKRNPSTGIPARFWICPFCSCCPRSKPLPLWKLSNQVIGNLKLGHSKTSSGCLLFRTWPQRQGKCWVHYPVEFRSVFSEERINFSPFDDCSELTPTCHLMDMPGFLLIYHLRNSHTRSSTVWLSSLIPTWLVLWQFHSWTSSAAVVVLLDACWCSRLSGPHYHLLKVSPDIFCAISVLVFDLQYFIFVKIQGYKKLKEYYKG